MHWSCSWRQLQSWLVSWLVNTWLLPPAIEGSKSFSYCTWLLAWFLACIWQGYFLIFRMFKCWSIWIEECFNIWKFEYSRCSTSGLWLRNTWNMFLTKSWPLADYYVEYWMFNCWDIYIEECFNDWTEPVCPLFYLTAVSNNLGQQILSNQIFYMIVAQYNT